MRAKIWAKDYLHAVGWQLRMYFFRKAPSHYLEFVKENKVPVVLIPGVLSRWAVMKPLADKISLEGHPVYIVPKLGVNFKDIKTSASIVKEIIDENKLKNIVILAHSKGGYIGKYLLKHFNEKGQIKKLISVGTPYSGTRLSHYLPHTRLREFSPESEMIKEISGYSDINHKIISINPSWDNLIWHENGAYLEGAKNINVKVAGHHIALNHSQVTEIILEELKKLSV